MMRKNVLVFLLFVLLLASACAPSVANAYTPMITLEDFTASVVNGAPDQVVGVYVYNLFALPVVQQPEGDTGYVADKVGVATQFSTPAQYGVTALLAHNYLDGARFSDMLRGDRAVLVYGDGRQVRYKVQTSRSYQAFSPYDTQSRFRDVGGLHEEYSAAELFRLVYTTPDTLVFQTCIYEDGEPAWGRMFVTATKELD